MKRRGFISGLMAAPLAVKARIARFFVRKPAGTKSAVPTTELCGAPILGGFVHDCQSQSQLARTMLTHKQSLTARQREVIQMLAEGKSLRQAAGAAGFKLAPRTVDCHTVREPLLLCSLPLGHKGPHMLLNTR